jgi:hypothetical protein
MSLLMLRYRVSSASAMSWTQTMANPTASIVRCNDHAIVVQVAAEAEARREAAVGVAAVIRVTPAPVLIVIVDIARREGDLTIAEDDRMSDDDDTTTTMTTMTTIVGMIDDDTMIVIDGLMIDEEVMHGVITIGEMIGIEVIAIEIDMLDKDIITTTTINNNNNEHQCQHHQQKLHRLHQHHQPEHPKSKRGH